MDTKLLPADTALAALFYHICAGTIDCRCALPNSFPVASFLENPLVLIRRIDYASTRAIVYMKKSSMQPILTSLMEYHVQT